MKGKRVVLFRFTGALRGGGVTVSVAGVLVVAFALLADDPPMLAQVLSASVTCDLPKGCREEVIK